MGPIGDVPYPSVSLHDGSDLQIPTLSRLQRSSSVDTAFAGGRDFVEMFAEREAPALRDVHDALREDEADATSPRTPAARAVRKRVSTARARPRIARPSGPGAGPVRPRKHDAHVAATLTAAIERVRIERALVHRTIVLYTHGLQRLRGAEPRASHDRPTDRRAALVSDGSHAHDSDRRGDETVIRFPASVLGDLPEVRLRVPAGPPHVRTAATRAGDGALRASHLKAELACDRAAFDAECDEAWKVVREYARLRKRDRTARLPTAFGRPAPT